MAPRISRSLSLSKTILEKDAVLGVSKKEKKARTLTTSTKTSKQPTKARSKQSSVASITSVPSSTTSRSTKSTKIPLKKTSGPTQHTIAIADRRVVQKKTPTNVKKQNPLRTVSKTVLPKPAILSPFRFPMIQNTRGLSLVAYAVGIVFVLLGTVSSFFHIPYVQHALIGERNTATINNASQSSDTSISSTNQEPRIVLQGDSPLSGTIPLTITVPGAESIELIVLNKTNGLLIPLGKATKVDESTWNYAWDTLRFDDAEYQIKIIVFTTATSYAYTDVKSCVVSNTLSTVIDTSELTQSGTSTPTVDASSTPDVARRTSAVSVVAETNEYDPTVVFRIYVENASKATMLARNQDTDILYYLGKASLIKEGEWNLAWDPINIPDGPYVMYPSATVAGKTMEGNKVKIIISNDPAIPLPISPVASSTQTTPTISMSLLTPSPLSKFATISITTSPVEWVEVYANRKSTLTSHFLGLATRRSDTDWMFTWDTTQSPNGEYTLYTRVKSAHGFTEGARQTASVLNETAIKLLETQESRIDSIHEVTTTLTQETSDIQEAETAKNSESKKRVYVQSVHDFTTSLTLTDEEQDFLNTFLTTFRTQLDVLLTALAQSKRSGDALAEEASRKAIEEFTTQTYSAFLETMSQSEIKDTVQSYIRETTQVLEERTLRNEILISERLKDTSTADADSDGVSDYDEIHLYKTNPFVADTDGDGYPDGSEIVRGYNPLNNAPEAIAAFESPRDTGVVRDDLFSITDIVTIKPEKEDESPKALITGKGLPNSFITLYIYSMPIVVTVKTNADGTWSYIFDKELEDGTHEVYVGIIDNEGTIVAKSNPLQFIKTAEAYTKADSVSAALKAQDSAQSFLSSSNMFIVASILIVAFGIILFGLGTYVRRQERFDEANLSV